MKQSILLSSLLLLVLLAGHAAADVYLEQVSSSQKNDNEQITTRMYISPTAIRIEEPDGKIVNITDFAAGQLITLDLQNNEYFTIPLSQIKEDIGRGGQHFRQSIDMKWRLEVSEETEMIAGYLCQKYVFHGRGSARGGAQGDSIAITLEFWISKDVPVPDGINARILDALGIENNPFVDPAIVSELKSIGGYPLRAVTTVDMSTVKDVIRQEVLLVSEVADQPERYEVPANFQRVAPQAQQPQQQ